MPKTNDQTQLETVLVTGATGALGEVVVNDFYEAGCTVIGADIDVDGDGVQRDDERDHLYWAGLDVADADAVDTIVSGIEDQLGGIDALVDCAGGFRWTLMDEVSDDDLDFLMDANLRGGLLMVRRLLGGMKERGFGRMVLISSKSTLNPGKGEGPYTATKSGLNAVTKAVSREVADIDVNINAVLPSVLDTPANRQDMPDGDFDRWVDRGELSDIIFELTQPLGDPINGALIPVTGRM